MDAVQVSSLEGIQIIWKLKSRANPDSTDVPASRSLVLIFDSSANSVLRQKQGCEALCPSSGAPLSATPNSGTRDSDALPLCLFSRPVPGAYGLRTRIQLEAMYQMSKYLTVGNKARILIDMFCFSALQIYLQNYSIKI